MVLEHADAAQQLEVVGVMGPRFLEHGEEVHVPTVLEEVEQASADGDREESNPRAVLGALLFRKDDVFKKTSVLSATTFLSRTWRTSFTLRSSSINISRKARLRLSFAPASLSGPRTIGSWGPCQGSWTAS